MLEEKDIKNYAFQLLRYLCQHDSDHICITEIYKNSGIKIQFERDSDVNIKDEESGSKEEGHVEAFEQVIKYLIDKEFLSYYVMPSEVNEDRFQDLHKTRKLSDTCGKVLISSLKQYDVDILD